MAITLNTQGSCTTSTRGTGLGDCIKKFGDPTGVLKFSAGWNISTVSGSLPTETVYKALIQAKTVYPFLDLHSFEQLTPDNEFATGSTGIKSEIRAGKPEFSYTYSHGYCANKNAYDKKGQNNGDIAFLFEEGVLFASNVAETQLKAFKAGYFSASTFKFQQGTDPEMTTISFQLTGAEEFNKRGVFYTWDSLGYDMNLIEGAINAHLEFQTAPAAGSTVNVTVVDDCNRSVNILGLTDADNWVVGGTQTTTAAVSSVSYNAGGYYVLTLDNALVADDTISLTLGSVSNSYTAAENTSGDLYTGSTDTATVPGS